MTKKSMKITVIILGSVLLLVGGYSIYIHSDYHDYMLACQLKESDDIENSINAFTALGDYKDSETQILEMRYQRAQHLYESGYSFAAADSFYALDGFGDSADRFFRIRYNMADSLVLAGDTEEALLLFDELNGFSNSEERASSITYDIAHEYLHNGNYDDAYSSFRELVPCHGCIVGYNFLSLILASSVVNLQFIGPAIEFRFSCQAETSFLNVS